MKEKHNINPADGIYSDCKNPRQNTKNKSIIPYTKEGNTKEQNFLEPRSLPLSLSPREAEVLNLLALGLRTGQIAHALGISNVTVDMHIRNGRTKLGATTREHAITLALHHKLITPFSK
ncbi:response regulator transcription factor [Thalassospira lucentensis]|uniref:response regulator transcription factor n=1 Tax=Thalassospira lucentensis TaxID=168935 RepID=UPI003D2E18CB